MAITMEDGPEGDAVVRVPVEKNRGGTWVRLGDEEYRIPALGFGAIQELQDDVAGLAKMGARPTPKQMAAVGLIVHAAMRRNYPSMTLETVGDMLDLGNYQQVLAAVLAIAGFEKAGAGPGEAAASSSGTTPTPD